jgi:hypothetical protein
MIIVPLFCEYSVGMPLELRGVGWGWGLLFCGSWLHVSSIVNHLLCAQQLQEGFKLGEGSD